jgi:hypothetical protein
VLYTAEAQTSILKSIFSACEITIDTDYIFKREDTFCGNNFKRTRKEMLPTLSKEYPGMFINELKGRQI